MSLKFLWLIILWLALLLIVINNALEDAYPVYQFSMNMLGLILTIGIVGLIKPQWVFLPNRKSSFLVFLGLMVVEFAFFVYFNTEIKLAMEQEELALKEARKANDAAMPLPSTINTYKKLTRSEVREICENELSHFNPNSLPDDLGEIRRKAREDVAACSARYGY